MAVRLPIRENPFFGLGIEQGKKVRCDLSKSVGYFGNTDMWMENFSERECNHRKATVKQPQHGREAEIRGISVAMDQLRDRNET